MGVVNIRRDVEDPFYRYKMPTLQVKVEGRGNGIKTVLVNMAEVAKALARPPAYPSKFLGGELGTQVKIDDKKSHYVINGAHEAEKLQSLLDVFIDKFVLCQACKNPETEFVISCLTKEFTNDDNILKDCKACGIHSNVDMRHRLTNYILKNRPEIDKNDKYRKGNDRAAGTAENSDQEEGMVVDDQFAKDLEALPTAEEVGVNEEDWAVDTSAAAAAARMQELSVNVPGEESELKDSVEEFADFVTAVKDNFEANGIIAKAAELEVREDKAITVLVQILLDENVVKGKQVEKHANLFKHFATNEKSQKGLLGGIERLVIVSYPKLLPAVSLILKALYDNDLVSEEVFLAWDDKASKKYVDKKDAKLVREKAAPFTKWLREAEEDDDDEE